MCLVISAMVFVNHYLAFDYFSSVWYPFSEVQFLFVAFLCVLFLLQAEMLVVYTLYTRACIPTTFRFFALSGIHWNKRVILLGSKGGAYTNVAQVWIPASTQYIGWICCWFSPLPESERLFSSYSGFPLFLKTNTSKCKFELQPTDTFQRVLKNFYKCSVVKQIIQFTIHKLPHHDPKITNLLNFIQHDAGTIIYILGRGFLPKKLTW